jgi:hypothetical protein
MNDKNEEQEVNPQPQSTPPEEPGATAIPPAGSNGQDCNVPRHEIVGDAGGQPAVSSGKVEANRQNSRNSTGPKTLRGKKNSSRNAIKHGLLTKELLITTGAGKESRAEFELLLAGLRDYYKPVGVVEDLLVQEIAVSYWRSKRALRSERGAVTLDNEIPRQFPELTESEQYSMRIMSDAEGRHQLLQSSRGLNYLLQAIEGIRKTVQSTGHLPLERRCWLPPAEIWDGGSRKKAVLAALDKEIAELARLKVQTEKEELHRRNATRDFASIPSKVRLDPIHRYDTSEVRKRRRAEARLDHLQTQRKQEAKTGLKTNGDGEGSENT